MDEGSEYYEQENGLEEDINEHTNSNNGSFFWGLIIGAILIAAIWGIGKNGKYEGQSAEDWFNEYDNCDATLTDYQSCVEDTIPNISNYCSP